MLTAEKVILEELNNLPEVEYPPEVVDRWVKIGEIAELKIATGELQPQTLEDFAAEFGIEIE